MKKLPITLILMSTLGLSVQAAELPYQQQYADQMGAEAPHKTDLTDATPNAEGGAVYANRNFSEFSVVSWNFAPSSTPLIFNESITPLNNDEVLHLEGTNTDGYIVVKDGTIVKEYYAKGMYKTTKHAVYSVGKSYTSATWHNQLLPVMDKTVSQIIPELADSIYKDITVRDVSDMRTPTYWAEDFGDPNSPVVLSGSATGWDFKDAQYEQISFLNSLTRNPELADGDWYYVSPNTLLLDNMGSELSGKHAYEGMKAFYDKLGFEYISNTVANLHGQVSADGGQSYTLRDFVKLPHAMAADGIVNGKEAISQTYIDDVFTSNPEKTAAFKNSAYGSALPMLKFYSNQWYVVDEDIAIGMGSFGQFIAFNKATNVAIAKFSTYKIGQDFETAAKDITWLIEQVKSY
ncbi:hypothetical protein OAG1_42020 [Agarivorans sp. OAG1]|uniref:hypothetical protein n=1 Tax=Agarivorans sp. OAG1 TaxID=3082387 RepID=UPI002B2ECEC0|nr:hypothetical protein OAG1_42020 [Agarivorans sp. OAG1]